MPYSPLSTKSPYSLAVGLRVECGKELNLNSKDMVEFILEV